MSYTTWDTYMATGSQTTGREPSLSPDKISTGNEPMLSQVQQNIMYLRYCLDKCSPDSRLVVDKEMVDRIIHIISSTNCGVYDAVATLVMVLSQEVRAHPYLDEYQWSSITEKTVTYIRQTQLQSQARRQVNEGLVESLKKLFTTREETHHG